MNAHLPDNDVSIRYYDSDYPSRDHGRFPENLDAVTELQGVACDVERYLEIAAGTGGPILELCCGTGRIAIPLARRGYDVTAVDVSAGMLERFAQKLSGEDTALASRVTLGQQDVTRLALDRHDYRLAIMGFNSLLCIPDFEEQRRALRAMAAHVAPGGLLAIDVINPLPAPLDGSPIPRPFFTRRSEISGRTYTRFAMSGPMDGEQKQRLHGWYDEVDESGVVSRRRYSIDWRPIFRYELALMLETAGLEIVSLEGGHGHEPFTAKSPHMFVIARHAR